MLSSTLEAPARPSAEAVEPAPRSPARRWALATATWAATALGAWLLHRQVSGADVGSLVATARWGWVVVAGCFSALALAGAAVNLISLSPVPLAFGRTLAVQVAGGFVKLISPAAIGGAAVNVRYVQRAGIPMRTAVTSVGAAQLVQFLTTAVLLAMLGLVGGSTGPSSLSPGPTGRVAMCAVVVGAVVVLGSARLRGRLPRLLTSARAGFGPAGTSASAALRRIMLAAGGSVLLTGALVVCLLASIAAFGGRPEPLAVTIVLLAGTALGSAVPTPGGIGAVEAALVTGLTAGGLPATVAVPAVLTFRLVTVWLPVPLGWLAFRALRKSGHL